MLFATATSTLLRVAVCPVPYSVRNVLVPISPVVLSVPTDPDSRMVNALPTEQPT